MATGISTIGYTPAGQVSQGTRLPFNFFPEDLSFLGMNDATQLAVATDGAFGSVRLTSDVGYDRSAMNGMPGEGHPVSLVSLPARHVIADHDLIRTVHTSAQLLHPTSVFTDANVATHGHVSVIKLNGAERFCLFGYLNTVTTAIGSGTNAVLYPYLVKAMNYDAVQRRFTGMTAIRRPDTDDYTGGGIEIVFNASPTTSNTMTMCGPAGSAGGWYISNPEPDRVGYVCRGYDYLFFLRSQVHGALTGTGAKMFAAVELSN